MERDPILQNARCAAVGESKANEAKKPIIDMKERPIQELSEVEMMVELSQALALYPKREE